MTAGHRPWPALAVARGHDRILRQVRRGARERDAVVPGWNTVSWTRTWNIEPPLILGHGLTGNSGLAAVPRAALAEDASARRDFLWITQTVLHDRRSRGDQDEVGVGRGPTGWPRARPRAKRLVFPRAISFATV
jgi:hypothetical protein